jgi:hypothetical protein
MTEPKLSFAPSFTRSEDVYNVLVGNGTFATGPYGLVDYAITSIVQTTGEPVPEPATMILFG